MSEICEHETFKDICGTCHRDAQITRLTVENERLRAALLVARKYVLVQSCELSLKPEDAARDLDVIDEALEEDDNG